MSGILAQGAYKGSSKTAAASPTFVSGSRTGTGGGATTNATTASGSGGTVSSYAWEYVSGDTLTINTPSAASTTFTAIVSSATPTKIGVYRCKVTFTDATFAYSDDVTAELDYIV